MISHAAAPNEIFGLAGAASDVGEAGQMGVGRWGWVRSSGLFFEAVGLSPAGWLSLVWILSISRATTAGFAGDRGGTAHGVEGIESRGGGGIGMDGGDVAAIAMRVETLLLKDGPGGGCRCVTPSGCGGWSVPRPAVLIASMTGWLPDRVGELHESGMTGDSPGSRAIHELASISTDLSSRQSILLREMGDPQNHGR